MNCGTWELIGGIVEDVGASRITIFDFWVVLPRMKNVTLFQFTMSLPTSDMSRRGKFSGGSSA